MRIFEVQKQHVQSAYDSAVKNFPDELPRFMTAVGYKYDVYNNLEPETKVKVVEHPSVSPGIIYYFVGGQDAKD